MDDKIGEEIEAVTGIERVKTNDIVLEGGSIELDSDRTMIATESAILNNNRNPKISNHEFESLINQYMPIDHFIWLKGRKNWDITDFHIDGFVKFLDNKTIVTMKPDDLYDWGLTDKDIDILMSAKNRKGERYNFEYLPLTSKNVKLNSGKNLKYKGSYINYYVTNEKVLVPNYHDKNDKVANEFIQKLYPNKKVIGIDVRELYKNGGMIHCVTQQEPK
ncbi:hypothetical protein EKQ61_04355 [Staphylococcus gallinarum]|uniref:Agmatine deiminase n=1 Tax=Staphylococcus gallinarum TaxID=1293 RepID=A0A380S9V0_STAGA|nr:hypothetical protein EKQ61_04355 [Staphylococcus gallinarum]GEQ06589.1 hypothetical protein SGA02_24170 [Staphylococcus gallinarum]SUQ38609.1 Agmatine deiminase [Staphylococcus gallinarum]